MSEWLSSEQRARRLRLINTFFNHAHPNHRDHRSHNGDSEVKPSEISATPRSASNPTALPPMTSDQEPSTPCPVGAGDTDADENQALETHNVKQIGRISAGERIKHWRRSSCQLPLSSAPVAEEPRYAASVDQLEILTEIATSYSGSMQGECIHGVRVSPASKKPQINPPAKRTRRGTKVQKRNEMVHPSESSSKNEDEDYQPINNKDFFFSKRRRSARIAALTKASN